MPRLSVIIPVYNVEQYLAQCLNSILAQKVDDMEIICVNDGSTDHSADILAEYAKKSPRLKIVTKSNGGLSSARNAGLDIAGGTYVGFVDSDDFIHPEMFDRMLSLATKQNADVIECGVKLVRESPCGLTGLLEQSWHDVPRESFPEFCYEGVHQTLVYVWNKIYRRSMLAEANVRFPEKLNGEDLVFNAGILPHCRSLYRIDDILYYYRFGRSGSITRSFKDGSAALQAYDTFLRQMSACARHWHRLGIFESVGDSLLPLCQALFKRFFFKLPSHARRAEFARMRSLLSDTGWDRMLDSPEFSLLQHVAKGRYGRVVWKEVWIRALVRSPLGDKLYQWCERGVISLFLRRG